MDRICERCKVEFEDDISDLEQEAEFPEVNWNICGDCLTDADLVLKAPDEIRD